MYHDDENSLDLFLEQEGLQDKIVALPYPVSSTEVYFALSRQSPCVQLVPRINAIIYEAKKNGTLQTIIDTSIHDQTDITSFSPRSAVPVIGENQ